MKAGSSRLRCVDAPGARDIEQIVGDEGALGEPRIGLLLLVLVGEVADALQQSPLGVEERSPQLRRDAQQLVAVFVADAGRHRHGHDAAEDAGPERVDEGFVAAEEQQQPVAGPCAELLQVMQDAERAFVQLAIAHDALAALAFVVSDRAVGAAVRLQHLAQRVGMHAGGDG